MKTITQDLLEKAAVAVAPPAKGKHADIYAVYRVLRERGFNQQTAVDWLIAEKAVELKAVTREARAKEVANLVLALRSRWARECKKDTGKKGTNGKEGS